MWEKLRRFSALDDDAQKVFLRALVMLPIVSVSLRAFGFQATQTALQIAVSGPNPELAPDVLRARIVSAAHMVNSAGRHGIVHASCLAKSLTLWCVLGRQGIASQLRIGIRKERGGFAAHAWVEREGVALNEPDDHHRHYAAFDKAFAGLPQDE
ncbi:MAG TPA: lasso peptide biosynthesis B2 protein [Methylomirabilota bacterium]|nr:lasso peptide biosynthesis B2 protein [Methylomirabilota bacterium]